MKTGALCVHGMKGMVAGPLRIAVALLVGAIACFGAPVLCIRRSNGARARLQLVAGLECIQGAHGQSQPRAHTESQSRGECNTHRERAARGACDARTESQSRCECDAHTERAAHC